MKIKNKTGNLKSGVKLMRPAALARANGKPEASRAVVPLKERRLSFGGKWDYAPAPETFEYIKIAPRYDLFIGGKFVAPTTGKHMDTINPATEEKLTEIALDAGAEDLSDEGDTWEVLTDPKDYDAVLAAIKAAGITPEHAEVTMIASTYQKLEGTQASAMMNGG